jgi:hypothetical protein
MKKLLFAVLVQVLLAAPLLAQAGASNQPTQIPAAPAKQSGYLSYIDFGGSSNEDGHVLTLGLSAGYQFNRHVTVQARLPFYFAGTSNATVSSSSPRQRSSASSNSFSSNGVGDPWFGLNLSFSKHALVYETGIAVSAPITSISNGFSTGDALVDWTSRAGVKVGRLIPFGRLDIGNTVPDTPLFTLPYTARGFNARLEGGLNVLLTNIFSAGASGYTVLPSGDQHVYSRMVTSNNSGLSMMPVSTGGAHGFMMNPVTVGNDLTSDDGFSTWLTANLPRDVDLQIAYSRSYGYDLNTVSFGIGYDLGAALRHRHANP